MSAPIVGKNTVAGEELRAYVERIERVEAERKQLGEDIKLIKQEAKSRGFIEKGINYVLKIRKKKPHDLQEEDELGHMYRHAMGMDSEPPVFRRIQAMARDAAGVEKLVENLKLLVPVDGELIVKIGAKRFRIWRDKEGNAYAEDYAPPEATPGASIGVPPRPKPEVPNCSENEAFVMGEAAAKANVPVIANPFPFGDKRRPRWDEGWRAGAGNDGMGGAG